MNNVAKKSCGINILDKDLVAKQTNFLCLGVL